MFNTEYLKYYGKYKSCQEMIYKQHKTNLIYIYIRTVYDDLHNIYQDSTTSLSTHLPHVALCHVREHRLACDSVRSTLSD